MSSLRRPKTEIAQTWTLGLTPSPLDGMRREEGLRIADAPLVRRDLMRLTDGSSGGLIQCISVR